jgi:hypothetical protein
VDQADPAAGAAYPPAESASNIFESVGIGHVDVVALQWLEPQPLSLEDA